MQKLLKIFKFLDDNLIKILLLGFIFIIPLYPKLPLFRVNFTYIAIRAEDLYLSFLTLVFFIQLFRKKVRLTQRKFIVLFVLFWISIFVSYLLGAFVFSTIDYPKVGFLHSMRRIEYMIVFFIMLSSIKSKKDFYHYIYAFFVSLFLVNAYGIGQKFFGLPAIQTMNPEFAKGRILYLTPEARVSSTFAGHYDLAAYLVFFIPITLGYYYSKIRKKWLTLLLFIFSIIILIYTASRTSFGAYIVSISLFLLFIRKFKMWIFVLILSAVLMFFTKDLTSRFLKTVQIKKILVDRRTGQVYVPQKISTKELPAGSFYIKIKDKGTGTDKAVLKYKEKVIDKTLIQKATLSGKLSATQSGLMKKELEENIKTVNTVVSDISFATRLQVEWPRAIKAWLSNPLFGTGPSSITESTDNDYLRWLGETGTVGTLLFLTIILSLIHSSYLALPSGKEKFIILGYIFATFGLLINATYIDVFEASKDAFIFWMFSGAIIAYLNLHFKKHET